MDDSISCCIKLTDPLREFTGYWCTLPMHACNLERVIASCSAMVSSRSTNGVSPIHNPSLKVFHGIFYNIKLVLQVCVVVSPMNHSGKLRREVQYNDSDSIFVINICMLYHKYIYALTQFKYIDNRRCQ